MHVNLGKRGVSQPDSAQIVRDYSAWPVVDNTFDLLRTGLDEQIRWKIAFWDALILAAARASGASELITEDLSPGQDYDGVRVVNPFL